MISAPLDNYAILTTQQIRFRDAGEEAMAKMKEQLELVLSRTAV